MELSARADLTLSRAILIYSTHEQAVLTDHNVVGGNILPGKALDLDAFRSELAQLEAPSTGKGQSDFVPIHPNLLAENRDFRVWWTPGRRRKLFIAGKPARCWLPPLVWCAHKRKRECFMWAMPDHDPKLSTVLYRPQFGPVDGTNHIHADSRLCIGSGDPKGCTPAEWEAMFYDTSFKTKDGLPGQHYNVSKTLKKVDTLSKCLAMVARVTARGA